MEEKRYSGTAILVIMGVVGVASFALLMYHLFQSDKTLPNEIKLLNRLQTERTMACDRSNDAKRCEAAETALEDYLAKLRKKAADRKK